MDERLLIVEDEETLRESLKRVFQREGYQVEAVGSAEAAWGLFEEGSYDLIVTDIILPGNTGIELLKRVKEVHPEQIVIIITAYASLETAVETLRAGAYDYIVKPIIHEEIKQIIKNALRQRALQKENILLKKQMGGSYDLSRIVGDNSEIHKIISRIKKIAEAGSPVLFIGELGTGKKLIARSIHFNSFRTDLPFFPVNCQASLPDRIESELFGQVKGTSGEAVQSIKGIFEEANGGTIYLDKVDELSDTMQVKLLRVLEDQEIWPVGASQGVKVDLLIIAASLRELEPLVRQGLFREDLYRRLKEITVILPPLRERKEDLEPLALFFIQRYARDFGKKVTGLDPEVLGFFNQYDWPGNIRELRNLIERAVLLADEEILKVKQFPQWVPLGR
jgi:DNA-binding NtrC family response regulator